MNAPETECCVGVFDDICLYRLEVEDHARADERDALY